MRKKVHILSIPFTGTLTQYFHTFCGEKLHRQPKNSPSETGLLTIPQTCHQQADIRMRSHGLRQLVDDKSVASCQQNCCKLIVKTCYPQACCKLFQQVITSLQMTSCNKLDFYSNNLQQVCDAFGCVHSVIPPSWNWPRAKFSYDNKSRTLTYC